MNLIRKYRKPSILEINVAFERQNPNNALNDEVFKTLILQTQRVETDEHQQLGGQASI